MVPTNKRLGCVVVGSRGVSLRFFRVFRGVCVGFGMSKAFIDRCRLYHTSGILLSRMHFYAKRTLQNVDAEVKHPINRLGCGSHAHTHIDTHTHTYTFTFRQSTSPKILVEYLSTVQWIVRYYLFRSVSTCMLLMLLYCSSAKSIPVHHREISEECTREKQSPSFPVGGMAADRAF